MRKKVDTTVMQSRTAGTICKLVHDMQKEIKRLSIKNDRANDRTKEILKNSAFLLKVRGEEVARVNKWKRDMRFYYDGI